MVAVPRIIVESLLARYMNRGSCEKMDFVTKSETVGHLSKHSVHMRSGKVLIRFELGKGPQNYGNLKVVVRAEALECSRG